MEKKSVAIIEEYLNSKNMTVCLRDRWVDDCFRGTQRLLSVKYLCGEANIARIFFFLRTAKKFLDERSIHVQFSKLIY